MDDTIAGRLPDTKRGVGSPAMPGIGDGVMRQRDLSELPLADLLDNLPNLEFHNMLEISNITSILSFLEMDCISE